MRRKRASPLHRVPRRPQKDARRSGRSSGLRHSCGVRLPAGTRRSGNADPSTRPVCSSLTAIACRPELSGEVPQNCAPCKNYRQQRKRSRPMTWDGICDLVVPPKFRRENLRGSARRPGNDGQTARLVSAHAPGWWDIAALCRVLAPYGRSLWAKTASRPHQRFIVILPPARPFVKGFFATVRNIVDNYTKSCHRNATEKLLRLVSPAGRETSSGISVRSLTWPSSAGTPCQGSRQT